MLKKVAILALGLIGGFFLGVEYYKSSKLQSSQQHLQEINQRYSESQKLVAELENENDSLKKDYYAAKDESLSFEQQLEEFKRIQKLADEEDRLAKEEERRLRMLQSIRSVYKYDLAKWKRELQLSMDQEAELKDFYESFVKAYLGEIRFQSRKYRSLRKLMMAILSESQKQKYEEIVQRKYENKRESKAYVKLSQIQKLTKLNEEQRVQIFKVLYEEKYKVSMDEMWSRGWDPITHRYEISKLEGERILASLNGVLSPEVLSKYKDLQQSELQAIVKMQQEVAAEVY